MKRVAALPLSLVLLAGCGAFRASAGVGLGVGASARVGVLDVGAVFGASYEWGVAYGVSGGHMTGEAGLPVLGRLEILRASSEHVDRQRSEGLLAALALASGTPEENALRLNRPTEVAVSLRLLFLSFHLGFDPAVAVRALFGMDEPAPPPEPVEEGRVPADPLHAMDQDIGPEAIDSLGDDPIALVRIRTGETSVGVAPGIALVMSLVDARAHLAGERGSGDPLTKAWERVARGHEVRGRQAFLDGERFHDTEGLARVLADCPLAPQAPRAARVLGDLRFERGELAEALEAFELEAALAEDVAALDDARRRCALARRLVAATGRAEATEAKVESVIVGPYRLTASEAGVTAVDARGEFAWVHTSSFAHPGENPGLAAIFGGSWQATLLGTAPGLALVAVGGDDPAVVVALDERGECRWRTVVPRDRAFHGHDKGRVVVAQGRVFFVSYDRAFALSSATGRLDWLSIRPARRFASTIPMECGPIVKAPREGGGVRVTLDAIEWPLDIFERYRASDSGRIERLDPRTGLPLGDSRASSRR